DTDRAAPTADSVTVFLPTSVLAPHSRAPPRGEPRESYFLRAAREERTGWLRCGFGRSSSIFVPVPAPAPSVAPAFLDPALPAVFAPPFALLPLTAAESA